MELNPNNPVVRQAHDHWHKIAALIMVKLKITELEITLRDLATLNNLNIVLDGREEHRSGKLIIRIVDDQTAARLAREAGGRTIDQ